MLSTSSFFSPDETAIRTKVNCNQHDQKLGDNHIDTVYEIERCIDWITDSNFKQVNSCNATILTDSLVTYLSGPSLSDFLHTYNNLTGAFHVCLQ